MCGACGIVYERARRIIVDAVVEYAGYHEHFLGARSMGIEGREPGAGIELENQRFGAICALPENAFVNSRKDFLRRNILPVCRHYTFKINHRRSPLKDSKQL